MDRRDSVRIRREPAPPDGISADWKAGAIGVHWLADDRRRRFRRTLPQRSAPMTTHNLDALFRPDSVAVIGASDRPGSVGTLVLRNVIEGGFRGEVFPVNPKHAELFGRRVVARVDELARAPDLAVLCTPPNTVPGIVAELAAKGTRAAVVLTAGLADAYDSHGHRLVDVALAAARPRGLRLLGPNCLGLLAPHAGLNASFAHANAAKGQLAFVSQSGGLCTAMIDWARAEGLGFSALVSLGDSRDIDLGDVLDYLGSDTNTRSILLYAESIRDARKFLAAARAASRNKPIVALKAGRVVEGMRAAASHTEALAGGDEVLEYALRRAGILRVREIGDLLDAAETLERLGRVRGNRLAIVTNGGGLAVLATDALVSGGGRVAALAPETLERLGAVLPPTWSRANPIDVIGDADAGRYCKAVEIVVSDPGVDAVLLLYVPTAIDCGEGVARAVAQAVAATRVPVLCSWLGRESVGASRRILSEHGLATYDTPETAVRAFLLALRHERAQELLVQTPSSSKPEPTPDVPPADVRARLVVGRSGWSSALGVMEVLAAYGIPVVRSLAASDPSAAADAARRLGFPVALKLLSPDVLHKTEVGGVALDLESPRAVEEAAGSMSARLLRLRPNARIDGFSVQEMARRPDALEVFVGAAVDPVFGPFVMFGQGGTAVEVIDDKAVALPPLNSHLADELMSRTRVQRLLRGYRGRPPADLAALRRLLVRVSQLVMDLPQLVELDVNPVLVDSRGLIAVDARLRLEPTASRGSERLSIRPYPRELEEELVLACGERVLVRPIRPEDEATHRRLFARLRPEDVRFRFFHMIRELPESEMARYTQIDYEREMAFIAIDPVSREELGVVRAATHPSGETADFAIIVAPDATGRGLGGALLAKLVRYLRGRGVASLTGRVLSGNRRMLDLAERLGFRVVSSAPGPEVEIRLDLTGELRGEAAAAAQPAAFWRSSR